MGLKMDSDAQPEEPSVEKEAEEVNVGEAPPNPVLKAAIEEMTAAMAGMPDSEKEVHLIIYVIWEALKQANKAGMPLSRNGAVIAMAEIAMKLTVAHARQTEGGIDRMMTVLGLIPSDLTLSPSDAADDTE